MSPATKQGAEAPTQHRADRHDLIRVQGARVNNLKDVSVGMKPCTNALYVSLISRCDSAAIVPNTSELLPEPDTPVKAVSRRFGSSTVTSLRLLTRAPCTRIRS